MPPLVPNEHSDALPDTSSVPDPSALNDEALSELLVKETRSRTGITPYPWQVRVAVAMIRQRDVLCLAGTGFGKTLPFIMPLFLSVKTIVWIVSPLNYIEEQQAESFKKWGAMAVAVNSNTDFRQVKKDILSGVYNVVISSPESFHRTNRLGQIVLADELKDWHHKLIIDEAHCIWTWGEVFRVEYARCGDMRGYMPPGSPVLLATATCTPVIRDALTRQLCLRDNLYVENLGNFRENLCYEVYRMNGGQDSFDEIAVFFPSADTMKRTIIFTETVNDTYEIAFALRKHFGWDDEPERDRIQPYNSTRPPHGKEESAREFRGDKCWILPSSDALTMGADFPDVEMVIQHNAPENAVVHCQRMGRGGRTKDIRCRAILMITNHAYQKAEKICERLGLTEETDSDTLANVLNMKVEVSDDEIDLDDPLGETNTEEDLEREDNVRTDHGLSARGQEARNLLASEMNEMPSGHEKESSHSQNGRNSKKSGAQSLGKRRQVKKTMDPDIAMFIAAKTCRTRVLDRIFGNPAHKSCESVRGCDNCAKKLDAEEQEPDRHALNRAVKREEQELEILFEDHDALARPTQSTKAKNRTGALLKSMQQVLVDWRKGVFMRERKDGDLELEDIMTDRALLAIAKSPTIADINSFDCIQPLWLSRELYGAEVLEVIRRQLEVEVTEHKAPGTTKTKPNQKARVSSGKQRDSSSAKVPKVEPASVAGPSVPRQQPVSNPMVSNRLSMADRDAKENAIDRGLLERGSGNSSQEQTFGPYHEVYARKQSKRGRTSGSASSFSIPQQFMTQFQVEDPPLPSAQSSSPSVSPSSSNLPGSKQSYYRDRTHSYSTLGSPSAPPSQTTFSLSTISSEYRASSSARIRSSIPSSSIDANVSDGAGVAAAGGDPEGSEDANGGCAGTKK
ncbi:ATP-dependent DNA helicase Q5 [Rhizoctonia solani]|uniref:DNA 3'-5' helicase n=1 Tax=Rhizoctonia solani TaxID=456999 RepID=A0A0K6FPP5_9AGAM|nr:ATP-dependent DNA helicase Q5 [Rhizoctonia solani]